jgi:hypothetical protein
MIEGLAIEILYIDSTSQLELIYQPLNMLFSYSTTLGYSSISCFGVCSLAQFAMLYYVVVRDALSNTIATICDATES